MLFINHSCEPNVGIAGNTLQHQAGCINDVKINPQLRLAAYWHTDDVPNNRSLDGDIGSDGSTPQDRAQAAGFHGKAAKTVAINPRPGDQRYRADKPVVSQPRGFRRHVRLH
jgi:hypothetical protein